MEDYISQISQFRVYFQGNNMPSFYFPYGVSNHPSFFHIFTFMVWGFGAFFYVFFFFSSLPIWSCRMMRTFCCFSDGKLPWTTVQNSCGSVSPHCLFPLHTNSFFNMHTSILRRTQRGKYVVIVEAKHVLTCSGRQGYIILLSCIILAGCRVEISISWAN